MIRIAVVSDIHGSLYALEAVVADLKDVSPDLVVHGGDLAVNGCRPAEVIDVVNGLGWPGVLGNTDEMLWAPHRLAEQEARAPRLSELLHVLFDHNAPATAELVGQKRIEWLRQLPPEWRRENLVVVHASPDDLWRAPASDSDDEVLTETYGSLNSDLVVYAHIHRPFVREMGSLTVINSGSAGLSYDGDWRAAYLVIDDGKPLIRRVEYNLEGEVNDLLASKYPYASWLAEIRKTGKYVPPSTGENDR